MSYQLRLNFCYFDLTGEEWMNDIHFYADNSDYLNGFGK